MKKALFWAFVVGTGSLLGSVLIINTLMPLMGQPIQSSMYWASVIGSYGIGSPVTFFLVVQNGKLRAAIAELAVTRQNLEEANKKLEVRANIDAMTGMLNREAFLRAAALKIEEDQSGMLLLIDIDHFKQINDNWGHLVGDRALEAVTSAIVSVIDENCIIGRLGGEEFGIIVDEANPTKLVETAENVRKAVEDVEFYPVETIRHPLTISIGTAAVREGAIVSDLMRQADRLLYVAKEKGRNRVEAHAA